MPGPVELDQTAAALWRAVEQAWDQQAGHDRFVQHAHATGALPAAAARYRAHAQAQPDDAIAPRMLARITFLATQQALRPQARPARPFTRSPLFLGVVVAGAVLGALVGLLGKGPCQGAASAPRASVAGPGPLALTWSTGKARP